MSSNEYAKLAQYVLSSSSSEEDALATMILLHTHHIWLTRPIIIRDRCVVSELSAATQRGAASAVASVWENDASDRSTYWHWYNLFNVTTPFEHIEYAPHDWARRVEQVRKRLLEHPDVQRIESEDQVPGLAQ